jgi:hypothetical protein
LERTEGAHKRDVLGNIGIGPKKSGVSNRFSGGRIANGMEGKDIVGAVNGEL